MSPEIHTSARGRTLAIGFGTTVAIWAVAYISLMEPGFVVGEILFGLLLLCLVSGGWVAGRDANRAGENPVLAGVKVGFVAALLNFMIVGSMLVDPETHAMHREAPVWIAGNFGASLLLAAIGGWLGSFGGLRADAALRPNWYYRFICVAAVAVFLLLITGGLVTGLQVGLAVPDWPNSFGHNMLLYPLSEMVGGVFYEHAHRLYGMLVGVTAITLAASMFFFDRRVALRALGIGVLLAVIVQGVLGGTRVTETSVPLAIVHGVFAQVIFATIVCMAAFTSTTWRSNLAAAVKPGAKTDRTFSIALTVLLVVQIGLGALYRHLHRAGGNPPEPLHPLFTHIFVALIVTLLAILVAGRAWGMHRDQPVLPALGRSMLMLIGVQLTLGTLATVAVWMSQPGPEVSPPVLELVVTTAHQVTGALLLANAALLMFWSRRLLRAPA